MNRLKRTGTINSKWASKLKDSLEKSFDTQLEKTVKEILLWFELSVKDRWRPPKPEYDETGKERPQPDYILSPEQYLNSIEVHRTKVQGTLSVTIRVKEGVHKPSGRTWEELHNLREYGSAELKLEAAPVWRPLWTRFKTRVNKITLEISNLLPKD